MISLYVICLLLYVFSGLWTLCATRNYGDDESMQVASVFLWPIVWIINIVKMMRIVIKGIIKIAKE